MSRSTPRTAPLGHGIYLRVLDVAPAPAAEALRSLAATIRRVRARLRLSRGRFRRRLARRVRRVRDWLRPRVRRVRDWLRPRLEARLPGSLRPRVHVPTHGHHTVIGSDRWRRLVRWLLPPPLPLVGSGATVAVDARGVEPHELSPRLGEFGPRTVFVVDAPDVGVLRDAHVPYEYAPTTDAVSAAERLRWIIEAYGVDRVVVLDTSGPGSASDG